MKRQWKKAAVCALMGAITVVPASANAANAKGVMDSGPNGDGIYESGSRQYIKGWACTEGNPGSRLLHIYLGNKAHGVWANRESEPAVDRACGHPASRGRHRFEFDITQAMKEQYGGQIIKGYVINPNGPTGKINPFGQFRVPQPNAVSGEYTNLLNGLRIRMKWNPSHTAGCSTIEGTAVSFPGGTGGGHGDSERHIDAISSVVGRNGCVRVVKVAITSNASGYWAAGNDSFRKVAQDMVRAVDMAKGPWEDERGQSLIQGDTIVIGSSAGAGMATAGLEFEDLEMKADRIILVSLVSGADISVGCFKMRSVWLREWLDDIQDTGTACLDGGRFVPASKDPVNVRDDSFRSYISSIPISIMVGGKDYIGCQGTDCGDWSAPGSVEEWMQQTSSLASFTRSFKTATYGDPNVLTVFPNGGHDLWNRGDVRKLVCKNIQTQVGAPTAACNSL